MRQHVVVVALGVILVASAAAGQVPIGPEFKINSQTGSNEEFACVADDPEGRFTVTWSRWNGFTDTMIGRRFDAAGVPQGGDFVINMSATGQQTSGAGPRVAYEGDGGTVVVWSGFSNVMARRYDAAGMPRGPEFVVGPPGNQSFPNPRVAAGAAGHGFVVAWRDGLNMRARPYDASGTGLASIVITSSTAQPEVAIAPDGGFVATWATNAAPYAVWARLYDAAGVPRGPAFAVSQAGNFKSQVAVATDASGGFAVAWHDDGTGDEDVGVVVRRLDAAGNPLTGELVANTFTPGVQSDPAVAIAPSGEAVVTWSSIPFVWCPPPPFPCPPAPPSQDGSGRGVFGRRLDAAGNFLGGEFQVNQYTTGDQENSAAAIDASGRITVVWEDWPRNGIYARRFSSLVPAALEVDRVAGSGSDGNGVFEAGETVSIEPAWRNTTSVPLTYAAAAAALAGPSGPVYALPDPDAAYGTFAPGATGSCRDPGDCYVASISGARPAAHWDATLTEELLPAGHASKAWAIHVGESFADMAPSSPFYRFVETLFHAGVTTGCGGDLYCSAASVLREQMPVFVLRSYVPSLVPRACVAGGERFADVPASSPYCPWIEELARRGVVAGCGGSSYCPTHPVARDTMAVYIGATAGWNPPACGTPMFPDVPASSPYCRWIEELARRGVVTGCGGGNYCPEQAVTREQMAVFLGVSFGLVLYGP